MSEQCWIWLLLVLDFFLCPILPSAILIVVLTTLHHLLTCTYLCPYYWFPRMSCPAQCTPHRIKPLAIGKGRLPATIAPWSRARSSVTTDTDKPILLSLHVYLPAIAPRSCPASVTTGCFCVTLISTDQLIRLFLFHNQTDLTDQQNASCDKRRRIGVRQKGKKWRW